MTNRKSKFDPFQTLLGVIGNIINQTGAWKIDSENQRYKLPKQT